ncbi:MAG TPA: acyl-CoA dehydrogenase family protein [Candidatus Binataceae bacterium]|nr:acyl-CoA dehydrogenase family protein [Candidatus Binataceae bacterium]
MANEPMTNSPQQGASMSIADIYANARALRPFLREHSDAIEEARTLPPDVVERMREAGVFRIAMPKSWGGPEMSTIEINEIIEEVSYANASAGWCIAIGCDSGFFSAFVEDEVARKLYPHLDMVTAGSITPGRADRVAGGYRISGQWPFASGIKHADLVTAFCMVYENGAPLMADNAPVMRAMLLPAKSVEILDTWTTTGMRGTGSYDFRIANLFVPEEHSFSFSQPAKRSSTLYRHPLIFVAKVFGVPLGMARAMIDQVVEVMQNKVEMPTGRLYKNTARVQTAIADAEMILGAARAYAYTALDQHWKMLDSGERLSQKESIDLALARINSMHAAREVIRMLYDIVGGAAIYAHRGPFDRALRDIETLSQHFAVQRRLLEHIGALLLKADAPPLPYL